MNSAKSYVKKMKNYEKYSFYRDILQTRLIALWGYWVHVLSHFFKRSCWHEFRWAHVRSILIIEKTHSKALNAS